MIVVSKEGHVEDQDHVLCVDSFAEIIWRRVPLALGVPSAMANERFLREGVRLWFTRASGQTQR